MKRFSFYIFLAVLVIFSMGCSKDFLDRVPSDTVPEDELLSSVEGQEIALNGIYRYMYVAGNHDTFGEMAINLALDLRCDDMALHALGHNWFASDYGIEFSRAEIHGRPANIWSYYYHLVFQANKIINSIDAVEANKHEKNYVKGQALAIRAYAHFRLVQIFQQTYVGNESAPGIPLKVSAEIENLGRAPLTEVYAQVEEDFLEALDLLEVKFENEGEDDEQRVSINRKHPSHIGYEVVAGLLSRMYMVKQEWNAAFEYAQKGIEAAEVRGHSLTPGNAYLSGFNNAYSAGWVWGLAINAPQSTVYASFFSHMDPFAGGYATLGSMKKVSTELYEQISFNDVRKDTYADRDYYMDAEGNTIWPKQATRKFQIRNNTWEGDYVMMRMAELHLNLAEAAFHIGNESEARGQLNFLLKNRVLNFQDQIWTGEALLAEIHLQRRIELWGEGHRYFDMMRLKEALNRDATHDPGMARVMNLPAGDAKWIMQIPQAELDANPEINPGDQNPL